jgi:hypothetical protein
MRSRWHRKKGRSIHSTSVDAIKAATDRRLGARRADDDHAP